MKLQKIFSTPSNDHFFFGYFDTSQVSPDDKNILAIKINKLNELPSTDHRYNIHLFNIENNTNEIIADTCTINFQQGSRIHWINNTSFITNDFNGTNYFSKIINIKTKKVEKIYDLPIYSISNNKKFAITLDYSRLYWVRRGYSYDGIKDINKNHKIFIDETVNIFDLDTGITKKLFNMNDVLSISYSKIMNNCTHYLEHVSISPDDDMFIFLHRFRLSDGGIYARLMKFDFNNNSLKLILDSGRISHFSWISSSELLFYGSFGNVLTKIRKINILKIFFKFFLKIYKFFIKDNSNISKLSTGDGYRIINVNSKKKTLIQNYTLNKEDGHPTPFNESFFITDTYPDYDNNNTGTLYGYNIKDDKLLTLDKLKSLPELDNSPLRCDLHPRFSSSKKLLSIDSMNNKNRSSIVYKIII